jgi:hypothetical protein
MADEIKAGLDTDQVTPETKPTELTIDEIRSQIKEELEGKYKNEISTRDQKLTQYQKDLKARMTEEERIKSESQSILNDLLEEFAGIASSSIGLDEKHKGLIKGSTKDEIKQSADLIKSFKDTIVKDYEKQIKTLTEEINILKANGTPPPSGHGAPTNERERLISLYNEAEKKGDGQAMFAIKEQIQKLPK